MTGYPMIKRPFYTHPDPERPGFSNSFDLLFRGLELVTGGQRLHRYDDYLQALASRGESPAAYQGYLQAFKYGCRPMADSPSDSNDGLRVWPDWTTSALQRCSRETATGSLHDRLRPMLLRVRHPTTVRHRLLVWVAPLGTGLCRLRLYTIA